MSILRAEKILDYLASPLSRCLRDENPYVRKTAALCVAKVFDLKPELCVEYGFIETLRDLIGDGNPMVSSFRRTSTWSSVSGQMFRETDLCNRSSPTPSPP
jgi:hypothetical protein